MSYGEGRFRCELKPVKDFYAVGFQEQDWSSVKTYLPKFHGVIKERAETYVILSIEQRSVDLARAAIAEQIGKRILFFTPVLIDVLSESQHILTNELIVKFKHGYSREDLEEVLNASQVTLCDKAPHSPENEYLVVVPNPTGYGPIETLKLLEKRACIESVVPNAIVEVER